MKKVILSFVVLLSFQAKAESDIYAYSYWAFEEIKNYMQEVDTAIKTMPVTSEDPNRCLPVYKNAIKNGVMDIRYALGYFDDSQGIDIVWDNRNFGLSPSLDIGIYNILRRYMTEPCSPDQNLLLCGFKQNGQADSGKVILEKKIKLLGNDVAVKMTLTHASATESFEKNTKSWNTRQKYLTTQSEENYFDGIGKADIVVYNGHSRDGGGPDFAPPLLDSHLHVNYRGYYQKHRPGIKRVLDLIKKNPNKDTVMTFFSCYSKMHFYKDLLKANPKQRLILSAETIDYFDSLKASVGYLEGFLRGTCGQELADVAKQGAKIKAGFQGFQIR